MERVRPLVLAAIEHLPGASQTTIADVCRHLGAELQPWKAAEPQVFSGEWPSAMVAGLPSGARRIPDDLSRLLGSTLPRLPVLLLCDEPLLRPTMTAHKGRVVLVGPPLTPSKVASRLRMILAASGDTARQPVPRWLGSGGAATERLCPHYWVAALRAGEAAGEPVIHSDSARGLTALLSLRRGALPQTHIDRVIALMNANESDAQKEAALFELLGVDRAVVHLDISTGTFVLYYPWRERALGLLSPRRAPRVWDFRKTLESTRLLRVRATGGDLLIASTALRAAADHEREQHSLLEDGGPAMLELLLGQKFEAARPFSTVIVELV